MEMRERIRAIRTSPEVNMTQAEFSTALGLAPTSAASWEKKSNPQVPTESMRLLICEKFGVNREWLDSGHGDMFRKNNYSDLFAQAAKSPLACRALQTFLRLDDAAQDKLLSLLDTLVSHESSNNNP